MFRKILVYIGGSLNILWGISHLIPTKSVVKGFGNAAINVNSITLHRFQD